MRRLFIFLLLVCFATPALADMAKTEIAGRHVTYWTPPESAERQPLILFSHGFRGEPDQSVALTDALSHSGYWVFAPEHQDAGIDKIFSGKPPFGSFSYPEHWTDKTFADRRDDFFALVAALKKDPRFKDRIDFTRIGLVGHSLGGYTVLGLAGGWGSWKLPDVKAVLALSPYTLPFLIDHRIEHIQAPVMYQGGTRDFSITPFTAGADGTYAQTKAPKYYVEFEGAGHFAWTNFTRQYWGLIDSYSIAFLDHYLKGSPAPQLTVKQPGVSALLHHP